MPLSYLTFALEKEGSSDYLRKEVNSWLSCHLTRANEMRLPFSQYVKRFSSVPSGVSAALVSKQFLSPFSKKEPESVEREKNPTSDVHSPLKATFLSPVETVFFRTELIEITAFLTPSHTRRIKNFFLWSTFISPRRHPFIFWSN